MTQTQATKLALHVLDVRHRGGTRVSAGLYSVLLSGQAERVITQRMQDICTLHTVEARKYVRGNITQRVPHVQTYTGRIREHILHKHAVFRQLQTRLRKISRGVGSVKRALPPPHVLPALLNLRCKLRGVAIRGGVR